MTFYLCSFSELGLQACPYGYRYVDARIPSLLGVCWPLKLGPYDCTVALLTAKPSLKPPPEHTIGFGLPIYSALDPAWQYRAVYTEQLRGKILKA